ncbi:MAG: GDYXXLXY domain-containing protein [Acidobacteriales bacterium]|nr:GDYXXLXY domain-containing protein [Terriglobales bacterium]
MNSAIVKRGIALALLQLLIVCSLAAKFLYERHTLPRVWVRTRNFDPNLPIRGRYVALQLDVDTSGVFTPPPLKPATPVKGESAEYISHNRYESVSLQARANLTLQNGKLRAIPADHGDFDVRYWRNGDGIENAWFGEPVNFYLPEHAADPTRLQRGEELWAEVSVPKHGLPRPIQLATKLADGTWKPLTSR